MVKHQLVSFSIYEYFSLCNNYVNDVVMIPSVLVALFPPAEEANIAFNSLRVDPEPRKSLASKQLSVDQNQLIAHVRMYNIYIHVR